MNELLKVFLSLSISGSLLILFLFACKPLYRKRFSKRWQYYIWLIVLLRFIIPFSPANNLLGILIPKIENAATHGITATTEKVRVNNEIRDYHTDPSDASQFGHVDELLSDNPVMPSEKSVLSANIGKILFVIDFLWLIWLFAALILMVYKITVYRSFVYYVRSGNKEVSDPDILNQLSDLCEQTGVKDRVELSVNPLISSPLLMGFFRPHIVLSRIPSDTEELQYILLHELTHCRLRDMYYKWMVQIVLCLHWFNPLVYLMTREINNACDLACDEALLLNLDSDCRKAYGSTLLAALESPGMYKQSIATMTLSENALQLKERLESIMKFQGKRKWSVLATVCSLLLVVTGAITGVYASAASMQTQINPVFDVHAPSNVSESHTVSENQTVTTTESITETVTVKPNITNGSVVFGDSLQLNSLSIKAGVGNLTVKRGVQYKIEVGQKLTDHAIYNIDYENGVLHYFDDYKGKDLQINNTNEGYDITITIPSGVAYDNVKLQTGFGTVTAQDIEATAATISSAFGDGKISGIKSGTLDIRFDFGAVTIKNCSMTGTLSHQGEFGSLSLDTVQAKSLVINTQTGGVDIKNCTINGAVTCKNHIGGITINGLNAASLLLDGQNGGLTMRQCTISNEMNVTVSFGGAEISGDIKGNITIEKGLGGFSLKLTGSKRNDYHIVANHINSGENAAIRTGLTIDGKSYSYDYDDANSTAPHTIRISDSNSVGNNMSVRFGEE